MHGVFRFFFHIIVIINNIIVTFLKILSKDKVLHRRGVPAHLSLWIVSNDSLQQNKIVHNRSSILLHHNLNFKIKLFPFHWYTNLPVSLSLLFNNIGDHGSSGIFNLVCYPFTGASVISQSLSFSPSVPNLTSNWDLFFETFFPYDIS